MASTTETRALIDATLDRLCLGREETFLDVGFGGGRALARAAEQTTGPLWGADFSPDMVREGHRSLAALVRAGRLNLITAGVSDRHHPSTAYVLDSELKIVAVNDGFWRFARAEEAPA